MASSSSSSAQAERARASGYVVRVSHMIVIGIAKGYHTSLKPQHQEAVSGRRTPYDHVLKQQDQQVIDGLIVTEPANYTGGYNHRI